ncbi:hypothetical protein PoB_004411300 [Plakobranchus ocellatus]|uniref:Uncharacterized protein n=1 Tax=Plakobranchus ocellatus TaxID=259542 RepID=A0AAV4BFI0_9GAST|nr:hypothetical protein PoB_004411300 [Plakobranchus ocellatus]
MSRHYSVLGTMDITHCYTLLVSCVVSFNNYNNSTKCSDMKEALTCFDSDPTQCDPTLVRHELMLLGFTFLQESPALQHRQVSENNANGTAAAGQGRETTQQGSSNKPGSPSKHTGDKGGKPEPVADMELYERMYVILKLIAQAKHEYSTSCKSKGASGLEQVRKGAVKNASSSSSSSSSSTLFLWECLTTLFWFLMIPLKTVTCTSWARAL